MKRSIIGIVALFLMGCATLPEKKPNIWIDGQTKTSKTDTTWQSQGLLLQPIGEKIGAFTFFQVFGGGGGQIYGGPTYSPTSWLQIGVGLGMEDVGPDDQNLRFGSFVYLSQDQYSLLGVYEDLGSGPFYLAQFNNKINERWGVGAMFQDGSGVGPRFQYNLKRDLMIWGAPLYEWQTEDWNLLIGLRYSF